MRRLKFDLNPMVKCYNHHAFAFGILQGYSFFDCWLCNNYLGISYYPQESFLSFDFYMDYIYFNPVFDREALSDDLLDAGNIARLGYIKNAIEHGRYVICCLDEFYVPEAQMCGIQHFNHNFIIYGCERTEYAIAGYDARHHFRGMTIKSGRLKKAQPNKITLLSVKKDYMPEIETAYIRQQLLAYINKEKNAPVGAYSRKGQYTGLEACVQLGELLSDAIYCKTDIELRPFYVLRDHLAVMCFRIERMLGKESTLADVYRAHLKNYEIFLMKCLKHNVGEKRGRDDLLNEFYRLLNTERELIEKFIREIE